MYIIVVGGGKVGYYLAKSLLNDGHEVLIIEKDKRKCDGISAELGGIVQRGDGSDSTVMEEAGMNRADLAIAVTGDDEDILRRAGIENADAFIAVTNGDNTNAMASEIAKLVFSVPRVVARLYDPVREGTFHAFGLMETVCPTIMGSDKIHELVTGNSASKSNQ